jgi:hypothetical protein
MISCEEARQRGRGYINSDAGAAAAEALGKLLEALENERGANDDDGRATRQTQYLDAEGALLLSIGGVDLRQRRMVVEAPAGSKVETSDFMQLDRDCVEVTPEGQVRIRQALARHTLDTEAILKKRLSGLQASNLRQNAKGRYGPLDGRLMIAGVDPGMGAADELRSKIVAETGYTVGAERGAVGRIPHAMWKRAERVHNKWAANLRMRGIRVQNVSAATIKDWCQKEGPLATLFHDARRDGAASRDAPDRNRLPA